MKKKKNLGSLKKSLKVAGQCELVFMFSCFYDLVMHHFFFYIIVTT